MIEYKQFTYVNCKEKEKEETEGSGIRREKAR